MMDKNSFGSTTRSNSDKSLVSTITNGNYCETGKLVSNGNKRTAQYYAAFAANLCIASTGMMYGWASPALLKVDMTDGEKSWIASMLMIGGIFGCLITIALIDRIGRKWTIVLTTIPYIISWIITIFAEEHVYWLYAARFIGGLSVGGAYCVLPMYIGEISDDAIRGAMGSLLDLLLSVGILFEYCVGPYISFKLLAAISLIVPLVNLLCCPLIPESPYFHLMKDNWEGAKRSLQTLRGRKDVEKELITLNDVVEQEIAERQSYIKLFTKYGNRKAVIIIFGLMFAQQFSGIGALLSYTEQIFEKTGGAIDPKISTIGVGVTQLGACLFATLVADNFGRRILLIISSLGSAVCLAATGIIFFLSEVLEFDTKSYADLTIAAILLYMVLVNIGLSSQTYVMLGELFPTNIKAVAVCTANLSMLLLEAVVTKIFEIITTAAGGYYSVFFIFSACTFLSFIFILIFVPETKGKSLEEIQVWLNKGKIPKKNVQSAFI